MTLPWSRSHAERDQEGIVEREAAAMSYARSVKADLAREIEERRAMLRVRLPAEERPLSLIEQMVALLERWDLFRGVRR